MGELSSKLRIEGNVLMFYCPGCDAHHSVHVSPNGWPWNNDVERPTLGDVLTTNGHYSWAHKLDDSCWCTLNVILAAQGKEQSEFTCQLCHVFVEHGMLRYSPNCSHALAGKTVPLPDLPDWLLDLSASSAL